MSNVPGVRGRTCDGGGYVVPCSERNAEIVPGSYSDSSSFTVERRYSMYVY